METEWEEGMTTTLYSLNDSHYCCFYSVLQLQCPWHSLLWLSSLLFLYTKSFWQLILEFLPSCLAVFSLHLCVKWMHLPFMRTQKPGKQSSVICFHLFLISAAGRSLMMNKTQEKKQMLRFQQLISFFVCFSGHHLVEIARRPQRLPICRSAVRPCSGERVLQRRVSSLPKIR